MLHVEQFSPLSPEVLETIVKIEAAVVRIRKEESVLLAETQARLGAEARYPGAWAFIGTLGKTPVGFAFGYPAIYEKERDGTTDRYSSEYLSSLCVLPDYQNQGYGTELLHHAEKYATGLGRKSIALFTSETNKVARDLYTREGWEEEQITERLNSNGDLYQVVHYVKHLND